MSVINPKPQPPKKTEKKKPFVLKPHLTARPFSNLKMVDGKLTND